MTQTTKKASIISRRALLQGVAGGAVLIAAGGTATALALPSNLLLPPGAQHDNFWGACIKCDRCRSICPTSAIGVAKLEDGIIAARAPKMEFRSGYCNTCDGAYRCIEICPTAALHPFDITTEKIGIAVIDTNKCELFGVSASCNKECIDACPVDALSVNDEGHLSIDEAICWGCGACEYVCPANAYRSYDGSTQRGINMQTWEGNRS